MAANKATETKPEVPEPKPAGKPSMQELCDWQRKHDAARPRKRQTEAVNVDPAL